MKLLYPLALAALCYSCSPKVGLTLIQNRPPLDVSQRVDVLDVLDPAPEEAELVGQVKINNPDYGTVLLKFTEKARSIGGNTLKILEHQKPAAFDNSCRVVANVLYMPDLDSLYVASERTAMKQIDTALYNDGCAIVHFYRKSGPGFVVGYDVHVGDEVITRARNNSKESVMVKAAGPTTFWARTEAKEEITADIRPGRHYYVRCRIVSGMMVGRPAMEFVAPEIGENEYQSINN